MCEREPQTLRFIKNRIPFPLQCVVGKNIERLRISRYLARSSVKPAIEAGSSTMSFRKGISTVTSNAFRRPEPPWTVNAGVKPCSGVFDLCQANMHRSMCSILL